MSLPAAELRAIIGAAMETSRLIIEVAGQEFTIIMPNWVDGDVTRLAQVVSNVLKNGAKYTHRGGGYLRKWRRLTPDNFRRD